MSLLTRLGAVLAAILLGSGLAIGLSGRASPKTATRIWTFPTIPTFTSGEPLSSIAAQLACDFGASATNLCTSETQLSPNAAIRVCLASRSVGCIVNYLSEELGTR